VKLTKAKIRRGYRPADTPAINTTTNESMRHFGHFIFHVIRKIQQEQYYSVANMNTRQGNDILHLDALK